MAALTVGEHSRDERLDSVDRAAEQHAEAPIPVVVPSERDRPEDAHAGVVAEDVDVAEDALRLVGRTREPVPVGDVELDRVHAVACAAVLEALQGSLDVVLAEVRDHDVHPCGYERRRHAEPDPARPTRDERGLALDLFHASSSPQSLGQEARARAFAARRPSSTASRSAGTGSSGNAASVSSKISRSSSRWSGCVKT